MTQIGNAAHLTGHVKFTPLTISGSTFCRMGGQNLGSGVSTAEVWGKPGGREAAFNDGY